MKCYVNHIKLKKSQVNTCVFSVLLGQMLLSSVDWLPLGAVPPRIHCPHLAREPAFSLLAGCSCWCTSSATNILHSDVVTVSQVGCLPPGQSLFVPAGHAPPCLRDSVDVAFSSVLVGVNFWPVDSGGATLLMVFGVL